MLAKQNRIVRKEDFARIKKYGRVCFSGNVELRIAESSLPKTRVGFIVGIQFSKKATERNKAKRWARGTLRQYLLKIKKKKDILVIIKKKETGKVDKQYIQENIRQALKKAGVED